MALGSRQFTENDTSRQVQSRFQIYRHSPALKLLDLIAWIVHYCMVKTPSSSEALRTFGIAVRPTLLFVAAFALNVTPHEAAHAVVAYLLGFSSTLFQMWVNPDAATASSRQVVAIATAGPIFSLAVGAITWLLYKLRYNRRPNGLVFLMLAVVGIYSFLGPVLRAACPLSKSFA
jgi:Peptidase M50B-like